MNCASFVRSASMSPSVPRWLLVAALVILHFGLTPSAIAQDPPAATGATGPKRVLPADPLSFPPRAWVVDAVDNELAALHHKNSYIRYRMHVVDSKGNQVRDVIESKDGTVARLILRNGKPLTDEQDKAERQRLNDMLESPDAYAKHVKKRCFRKKDRRLTDAPDARRHDQHLRSWPAADRQE